MQIGRALSSEKNPKKLLETILHSAKRLTGADGGTIYTVIDDNKLEFEFIMTDSLGISLGGDSGEKISLAPLPLFDEKGEPNKRMVATSVVHENVTVNIPDAYNDDTYDTSGLQAFDKKMDYKTTSILTIPMANHESEIIGVLQLINAKDPETLKVTAFSDFDRRLAEALASQAAVSLTTQNLVLGMRNLFESFIQLIATAIDQKSPFTGSHCRRIPVITMMLAEACHREQEGELKSFVMNDDDRYEIETAAWLHDCGKITTPEYIMDKATKLETIFDRIELIDTRIEILIRDAEIAYLKASNTASAVDQAALLGDYEKRVAGYQSDRNFLRKSNIGKESMSDETKNRILSIAEYQWTTPDGEQKNLLTDDEVYNLSINRGTLNSEERTIINDHMVSTLDMLESLPFPKSLRRVPEYAGGHHERMDGNGYPKGLTRDEKP